VDLALLYEALDVPDDNGPGFLLHIARQKHFTLPYLILSVLARDGDVPMSEAARGELARAWRRAEHYEAVLARVAAEVPVQVMKGPLLARSYPEGVLRPQADLDLITTGEPDLWRVVRLLMKEERPEHVIVSVLGAPTRHVVVALTGPPEDPLLDPEMRYEVATAALVGDFAAVPVRAALPADPLAANLLALAEERFQRPFHPRDAIDVHQLGRPAVPSLSGLVETVAEYHLAPELTELLDYAGARVALGSLAPLAEALAVEAKRERERRAAVTAEAPPPGTGSALDSGRPLYGMPLRPAGGREDWDHSRVHRFGDDALLLTPVGDYLLVTGELVSQEQYDAAVRELDRITETTA
jgi:hypothetical protein